jgi:Glycosyl transferase family 2
MANPTMISNTMIKPTIICLTPVKNEAWILERFLKCASLWADYIIIADQNSGDSSQEIARRYSKVILVENSLNDYNESARQQLLLEKARTIPGPRLLIALDADEMLTANFMENPEWQTVLTASPGTIIEFEWVNILPDFSSYWSPKNWFYPLGFMDDGSEHSGLAIHSPRIPEPPHSPRIRLKSVKLLHYQYTNWDRVESKRRWYQCWEILHKPSRRAVIRYRMYNDFHAFPKHEVHSLCREWFRGYEEKVIDMTSIYKEGSHWQDRQILDWIRKYGAERFKKVAIWDTDWSVIAKALDVSSEGSIYEDPRSRVDKTIHYWLKKTQHVRKNILVRIVDKLLIFVGW